LIAGERRWRAAQLLQLAEAPVITREADDRAVLELALIENLQRENLNASRRRTVTNNWPGNSSSRRRKSPRKSAKAARGGQCAAVAETAASRPELCPRRTAFGRPRQSHSWPRRRKNQQFAAERVIKQGLNVRQTEGFVAKLQKRGPHKSTLQPETVAAPGADPHVANLEDRLREKFGTKSSSAMPRARERWNYLFQRRGTGANTTDTWCSASDGD